MELLKIWIRMKKEDIKFQGNFFYLYVYIRYSKTIIQMDFISWNTIKLGEK